MGFLDLLRKQNVVLSVPIEEIRPNPAQPRRFFSPDELQSLAESIRANGLLQPVLLRRVSDGFELIAGERRLQACRMLGQTHIDALLCRISAADSAVWALTENLQRSGLSIFDEAEGIAALLSVWGVPREEAARRLGMSPSALSNKIRLLKLPADVREEILRAGLTERHARALLRLPQEGLARQALKTILQRELNVRQTEEYIAGLLETPQRSHPQMTFLVRDVRLFLNTIERAIETMKRSGIEAEATVNEKGGFVEYVVRVPRQQAIRPPKSQTIA